jgi:hypothetical protein
MLAIEIETGVTSVLLSVNQRYEMVCCDITA